jgi:hypothetical protein
MDEDFINEIEFSDGERAASYLTEAAREREQYPLYPELSEEGCQEAQILIDRFKNQLKKAADEIIGDLYVDVPAYIESDSWTNFRNTLMAGFKNYGNRKIQGDYDFKEIRAQIYKDFREEIIEDLNQDNLKKIEELEKEVARLRENNNCRFY